MVEIKEEEQGLGQKTKFCDDYCPEKLQEIVDSGYKVKTIYGGLSLLGIIAALAGTPSHIIKEKKLFGKEIANIQHNLLGKKPNEEGFFEGLEIRIYEEDSKLLSLLTDYAESWEKKYKKEGVKANIIKEV